MNVVDSSAWLEYLAGTPQAKPFVKPVEDTAHLLVPAVVLTEVFRCVLRQAGEQKALEVAGHMQQGAVAPLDERTALEAARLGHTHKLPLADSIILATARLHGATLWTQDRDFKGLPGVKYYPKPGRRT